MRTLRAILFALIPAAVAFAQSQQPSITTTSPLPSGVLNQTYTTQVACTGCSGYTFGLVPSTGSLPNGLNLSPSGIISGIPTAVGTFTFTLGLFAPGNGTPVTQRTFTLTIPSGLTVLTTTFANGTLGTAYSQVISASGGVPPYVWSITSGALPPGLGIQNGSITAITGTPTATGTYAFKLTVNDSQQNGAFVQGTITIGASSTGPVITTTTLPNGVVNVAYNAQLACSNCAGYSWSLTSGLLPLGLSLNASGAITGTPTTAGSSSFQITLTPPATYYQTSSQASSVSQIYTILINGAGLGISQTTIPIGFTGTAYSSTLTATGGLAPYAWSLTSTNNDGITIGASSGTLTGTPTANGTFFLTVQVADSSGLTYSKQFTLTVSTSLSVLTTSLPNGTVGTVYPQQALSAGGGQPPYRWTIASGTLPPGLTLNGTFGYINGTPTTNGNYPFTVSVTDNQSNTATGKLSITIGGAVTITISPATLTAGTVGTAYAQTLTASGGTAPYTWSITSGTVPTGLTLNPSTGAITGTPTTAATSTFTVQATDSNGATGTQAISLTIAAATTPLSITTASLPNGTTGATYSQTLAATGGVSPYTWSVTTGTLPAGLALNGAVISGTPTTAVTSSFTVQVKDSAGTTATKTLGIVIAAAVAPLSVTAAALPAGTVGTAYSQTPLIVTGGTSPYSYALTSSSNDGLTIGKTGTIAGTPTAAGTFTLTVVVTDSSSPAQTSTQNLSLTVNAAAPPAAPAVTLAGVPATSGFEQQLAVTPTISAAYNSTITGTVVLTFTPSVTPPSGSTGTIDDAMIQFSGGGRTATFTIAAGSTTAGNLTVLTGTTAGTITLTTTLSANGATIGSPTTQTILDAPGVPFISKDTLKQAAGGVTVVITGFSSTRDLINASFAFAPATGDTFTSDNVSVPIQTVFNTWWANTAQSNPYGTQFTLTVPFTLATPTQSVTNVVIVSVTVTLQNSKGASNPVTISQ